jgi:transcriptional regulator with XRE-family HTH domain
MSIARNFRIIREFRGKTTAEVVKDTGISKQNISAWEKENNNPGHKFLDQLSKYFDVPRSFFYKENLTVEDLKAHFSMEKHTPAIKNNEQPLNPDEIYRDLVEANSDYRLVPKTILDGEYRMILKSEIDSKTRLLEETLAAKNELLADKNKLIAQLNAEINSLRSKPVMDAKKA